MKTLEQVLQDHPSLTYGGFWGPWRDRQGERQSDRQRLAEAHDEFNFTVDWLQRNLRPTKRVGVQAPSSYYLKHLAEKEYARGYIANGVLLAAALALGYPWRQHRINAWIGVSAADARMVGKRIWQQPV